MDHVGGKPTLVEQANAKLEQLGIDAGTPLRIKNLEARLESAVENVLEAGRRISELERMLAEAPTVYGRPVPVGERMRWSAYRFPETSHTAKLVEITPIEKGEEMSTPPQNDWNVVHLHGVLERVEKERDEYREALRFYATHRTYSCETIIETPPIDADAYGTKARTVLEKWETK
jgi:hypothetical protein